MTDFSSDFSGTVAGLIKFFSLYISVKTINKTVEVVSRCITAPNIQGSSKGAKLL